MTLSSVELLNEESVPKDAAAIIINAPQKDFNKNDAQKVIDYLQKAEKRLSWECIPRPRCRILHRFWILTE